ncbi:dihydroneopterin aldolase [Pelomonas sp. KK5]|uniref:dihydroneopterin aldolase n=1 Tax=Pelomonas sp. KK5 TaxID=1855730 RepID=UPI00097C9BC2|nr:dihydroneopterin aldolase [Pelomonas sp. KK5]
MNAALAPTATAEPQGLDVIFIEGLRADTIIGIYDSELHAPQPLVIDVQAGVPHARACDTDRIGDTIDYGRVRERLLRLLAEHRLQLLEALAETIASEILIGEFGARWVRVKVVKPRKFDDVQAVGVMIERWAPASSHQQHQHSATVLQLLGSGMCPGER